MERTELHQSSTLNCNAQDRHNPQLKSKLDCTSEGSSSNMASSMSPVGAYHPFPMVGLSGRIPTLLLFLSSLPFDLFAASLAC